MKLTITITNKEGNLLFEQSATDEIFATYKGEYQEGDKISIEADENPSFIVLTLDDCMQESFAYLDGKFTIEIPFGEKKMSYNPKAFTGETHYLYVRKASVQEISSPKNLAFNPFDCHENKSLFPHTWANVETRGESVFASRNAIDGYLANTFHGEWPYSSWGINKNPDAEFHLEFGRKVKIDAVEIYLRADFPHDAWWTQGQIDFSDGTSLNLKFEKRGDCQKFTFEQKIVESLTLYKLIKAEDPSPFPALTQIKVYGTEAELK